MSLSGRALARRIVPRAARAFARHPLAPFAALWQRARFRLAGPSPVVMMPDWTARAHPESLQAFRIHAGDPGYRRELQTFIHACTPGMRLVDVGASYGVFTLAALRYGGPEARVMAVEPSAAARRVLEANIAAAAQAARVRVIATALAAPEAVSLAVLPTGAGQAHMMVRGKAGRADASAVPATTLDALAAGFSPTHVKIDVEGFERDVLEGAAGTLRRDRPVLFLELHCGLLRELGEDPAACLALLRECGYEQIEMDGVPAGDAAILHSHIANLICRAA